MDCKRVRISPKIATVTWLFGIGAAAGWLYEVLLHLIGEGAFVNRGMLHGPWLPIYGIGCVSISALKKLAGNRPVRYFAISVAACGVMEYAASWLMESIYHTRWWDYSAFPLNLHGRVFLAGLIGFGAAGTLFAYAVLPLLTKGFRRIPPRVRDRAAILFLLIFAVDALISLIRPNMGAGITCF